MLAVSACKVHTIHGSPSANKQFLGLIVFRGVKSKARPNLTGCCAQQLHSMCLGLMAQWHQCPTFKKRFLVLVGSIATLCISATPLAPCPCMVYSALPQLPMPETTGKLTASHGARCHTFLGICGFCFSRSGSGGSGRHLLPEG